MARPASRTFTNQEKLGIALLCGGVFFFLLNPLYSVFTLISDIIQMPATIGFGAISSEAFMAGKWQTPVALLGIILFSLGLSKVAPKIWPTQRLFRHLVKIVRIVAIVMLVTFIVMLLMGLAGSSFAYTLNIGAFKLLIQIICFLIVAFVAISMYRKYSLALKQIGWFWFMLYTLFGIAVVGGIAAGIYITSSNLGQSWDLQSYVITTVKWFAWAILAFSFYLAVTWNSKNFKDLRLGATNETMDSTDDE